MYRLKQKLDVTRKSSYNYKPLKPHPMMRLNSKNKIEKIRSSFKDLFFTNKLEDKLGFGVAEEDQPTSEHPQFSFPSASEFFKKFELGEFIGEGTSGVVRKCFEISSRQNRAVKIIRPRSEETMLDIEKEFRYLHNLSHPSIVKLEELYIDKYQHVYFLVMPLIEGISLQSLLKKRGQLDETTVSFITYQLVCAVVYLHSLGIIHRDLKPANILYNPRTGLVTIIDFNVASFPSRKNSFDNLCIQDLTCSEVTGTLEYRAPDMLVGMSYTKAIDLWAIGCIVIELLSGKTPFHDEAAALVVENIKLGKVNLDESFWASITREAQDFIKKIMHVDPQQRLTASEAVIHPWIIEYGISGSNLLKAAPLVLAGKGTTVDPGFKDLCISTTEDCLDQRLVR